MMGKILKLAPILLLILPVDLFGQEDNSETQSIEMSGFFDVVTAFNQPSHEVSRFSLGQAELDLTKKVSPMINTLIAVCYSSTTSAFGVGVATVDIHPANYSQKSWGALGKMESFGLIAGKFDIPFGLDWQQYGSITRKLITMPTVCAETHAGWNDIGLQAYFSSERLNFTTFAVNGFASMAETSWMELNLETNEYEEQTETINTTPSNAFGARLGLKPVQQLEVGASYAEGLNKSDKVEMSIWGLDSRAALGNLMVQGEYISHTKNRSITNEKSCGYYILGEYSFGRLGLTSRFDRMKETRDGLWSNYLSLGNYFQIYQASQIRFEYRINDGAARDMFYGQLAVGF